MHSTTLHQYLTITTTSLSATADSDTAEMQSYIKDLSPDLLYLHPGDNLIFFLRKLQYFFNCISFIWWASPYISEKGPFLVHISILSRSKTKATNNTKPPRK